MQAAEALLPRAHVRLRRIDLRVSVGVLLMIVAVLGGASLIKSAEARTPVLVAARTVEPGQVIGPEDVRVAGISLSGGVAYLSASMRGSVVGQVATEPLWPGKLLGPNSVSNAPPLPAGYVAMSLLLKPDHTAGGALRAGDHVAVISTPGQARGGDTTILFTDVVVMSVSRADASQGGGDVVTLRLLLQDARALAAARGAGDINLVLKSGASS